MCHDKVTILLCATFAVTFMRKENPMIEQRQEHTPLNFVSDQIKNLAQERRGGGPAVAAGGDHWTVVILGPRTIFHGPRNGRGDIIYPCIWQLQVISMSDTDK